MGPIIELIAQVLQPLSIGLVFTAIVAGFVLAALYNRPLNLDAGLIFHKAVAGWVFIMFIFIYRLVSNIAAGESPPAIFGWIGIGLLWAIFCAAIYFTDKAVRFGAKKLRYRHR